MLSLAITVNFSQRAYNINESNGRLQPILFFSNPSSIDITLQVEDASNTAIGKFLNVTHFFVIP